MAHRCMFSLDDYLVRDEGTRGVCRFGRQDESSGKLENGHLMGR